VALKQAPLSRLGGPTGAPPTGSPSLSGRQRTYRRGRQPRQEVLGTTSRRRSLGMSSRAENISVWRSAGSLEPLRHQTRPPSSRLKVPGRAASAWKIQCPISCPSCTSETPPFASSSSRMPLVQNDSRVGGSSRPRTTESFLSGMSSQSSPRPSCSATISTSLAGSRPYLCHRSEARASKTASDLYLILVALHPCALVDARS
jgi:hypothetical protein